MSETLINIPGRLHSVATEGVVTGADEVMDDNIGEPQSQINANYNKKLDLIINDIDQSREIILEKLENAGELEHFHVTSYIIDQSNPIGLPATFIRKTTASKDAIKTIEIDEEEVYIDVIKRIWANTKLCVGLYDSTNRILKCKEVSREDKSLYADGTPVVISESDEYDVFMKLPSFYWRCSELDTDIAHIEFSMSEDYVDNTWHFWDGSTFIGVYKAHLRDTKIYSKPGVSISNGIGGIGLWRQYARNRGHNNNYSSISYESHRIMTLLLFGWFNTTKSVDILGTYTSSDFLSGGCDNLGITDGVSNQNNYYNLWGLEGWIRGGAEVIDNIKTINTSGVQALYERDLTTVNRNITTHLNHDENGTLNGLVLGSNGDVFPDRQIVGDGSYSRGFATRTNYRREADCNMLRSLDDIAGSYVWRTDTYDYAGICSRLEYKGDYEFVESFV